MKRLLVVLAATLGISCVSMALGMLYLDVTHRESALDLLSSDERLSQAERARLRQESREAPYFMPALFTGTAGVAMIAAALAGAYFESRFCRSHDEPAF